MIINRQGSNHEKYLVFNDPMARSIFINSSVGVAFYIKSFNPFNYAKMDNSF
jgi:hypothetical protein